MKEQSGRTFVEPVERPFRDGEGIENGFAEIRTSKRIQAGVGGAPDHVAVPFDKDVVHGAVVTAEFLQVAALRRGKISDFFGLGKIADVVAAQPGNEVRIGDEFLARLSRRFEMRRIVRAKAATLETKIAIGGLGRRNGPRKLGDRDRILLVANIDDPVRQVDLVAVGVRGFAVCNDEAAFKNPAVNRVESDAHAGVDRKSTRLNSSHSQISYAVFCLKKKYLLANSSDTD